MGLKSNATPWDEFGDGTKIEVLCQPRNGFCLDMGSDENRFGISFTHCEVYSHKTVSTNQF